MGRGGPPLTGRGGMASIAVAQWPDKQKHQAATRCLKNESPFFPVVSCAGWTRDAHGHLLREADKPVRERHHSRAIDRNNNICFDLCPSPMVVAYIVVYRLRATHSLVLDSAPSVYDCDCGYRRKTSKRRLRGDVFVNFSTL